MNFGIYNMMYGGISPWMFGAGAPGYYAANAYPAAGASGYAPAAPRAASDTMFGFPRLWFDVASDYGNWIDSFGPYVNGSLLDPIAYGYGWMMNGLGAIGDGLGGMWAGAYAGLNAIVASVGSGPRFVFVPVPMPQGTQPSASTQPAAPQAAPAAPARADDEDEGDDEGDEAPRRRTRRPSDTAPAPAPAPSPVAPSAQPPTAPPAAAPTTPPSTPVVRRGGGPRRAAPLPPWARAFTTAMQSKLAVDVASNSLAAQMVSDVVVQPTGADAVQVVFAGQKANALVQAALQSVAKGADGKPDPQAANAAIKPIIDAIGLLHTKATAAAEAAKSDPTVGGRVKTVTVQPFLKGDTDSAPGAAPGAGTGPGAAPAPGQQPITQHTESTGNVLRVAVDDARRTVTIDVKVPETTAKANTSLTALIGRLENHYKTQPGVTVTIRYAAVAPTASPVVTPTADTALSSAITARVYAVKAATNYAKFRQYYRVAYPGSGTVVTFSQTGTPSEDDSTTVSAQLNSARSAIIGAGAGVTVKIE